MGDLQQISAKKGTRILTGAGPHTGFSTRMIVCRVAGTIIAGYTESGNVQTLSATSDYPANTALEYPGEIFTFAGEVTSITLTAATDSITIVKQ
jgi:hypothetical protein